MVIHHFCVLSTKEIHNILLWSRDAKGRWSFDFGALGNWNSARQCFILYSGSPFTTSNFVALWPGLNVYSPQCPCCREKQELLYV
jgi:hypothetical protein